MRLSFADCLLDTYARQVFRASRPVHLSPKAYELLVRLAEARPKALSKDELYAHLWPDTFVVEANLSNLVGEVRSGLGDNAHEPRIIRTVHGFGYAFRAEARVESAGAERPASCCLVWNARRLELVVGENVIGREPDAQVCFDLPSVSRHHAKLVVSDTGTTVEDLGSKNGTLVRGRGITKPTPLHDGDEIQLGSVKLTFRTWTPSKSTETVDRT